MTARADRTVWFSALRDAARARGLRHVGSGWAAVVDDDELYVVSGSGGISAELAPDGTRSGSWTTSAKPMVLDALLWRTLDHDSGLDRRQQRVSLRVGGAVTVGALPVGHLADAVTGAGRDARAVAAEAIDQLISEATVFRMIAPDLAGYTRLLDERRATRPDRPEWLRLERVLCAVALGETPYVRRQVDEAVAAGERGFVVGELSVWQRLQADLAAGAGVFAGQ
jgi:hypothetical protein